MKTVFKRYILLIWISLILLIGFTSIIALNFYFSKKILIQNISENTLPSTSDYIYSEIQKDILKPVLIASKMANDPFLRDFVLNGEQDTYLMTNYLKDVKERNSIVTSYFVSNRSYKYYQLNGQLKTVNEKEAKDKWFFRLRSMKKEYETNVDIAMANQGNITIFTNYPVVDLNHQFIGVVGVGITFDKLKNLIKDFQKKFHRHIYFTDSKGNVVLSDSNDNFKNLSILKREGISKVANNILMNKSNKNLYLEYQFQNEQILLNSRYIPELDWHILIEQNGEIEIKSLNQLLIFNIIIFLIFTIAVLIVVLLTMRRYQNRIKKFASTDQLTRLINRHAFDFVFQQAILDSDRTREPLCVALMDIDHFKKINDVHGHLVGNHVLREIALIAKRSLRESDVICRWGGEEFLILLKNCSLEKSASIAETLRSTIEANDFSRTTDLAKKRLGITVSIGVAQCLHKELEDGVFERANTALYQAKESGRNCVYFSE
jgi:diguanylate cyclase (GGDEF)-like protein